MVYSSTTVRLLKTHTKLSLSLEGLEKYVFFLHFVQELISYEENFLSDKVTHYRIYKDLKLIIQSWSNTQGLFALPNVSYSYECFVMIIVNYKLQALVYYSK